MFSHHKPGDVGQWDHIDHGHWISKYIPLTSIAIEAMAIEIVDLPIKIGGSFHSYVNVYQRVVGGPWTNHYNVRPPRYKLVYKPQQL